ncbi:MAG TPA: zinc dependent phospholipase C family protein [Anaerolineae bacterium]|nr:zinc dependent phospholipase C family protein [Anaerolineae bacterium]
MAPFNTHFLIAERIWPDLPGPWQPYYGQFCFGCVAPDVDKVSSALTQKETHFFDRTGDYELMASHRSATFLQHQAEFLIQPFAQLSAEAQAFVLGYLCHLCVDEVSKHLWRRETWLQFRDIGPGAAFAALDELVHQRIQNYGAIAQALCSIEPLDVIPRIPIADLAYLLHSVCRFAQAETLEEEYLALVDLFDRPTPEERAQKQQTFLANIDRARQQTDFFRAEILINASLALSYSRLRDLIEGRTPEPGYPNLE